MKMCYVGRYWNQEALDLKERCKHLNIRQIEMDVENGKNRTHMYCTYGTLLFHVLRTLCLILCFENE